MPDSPTSRLGLYKSLSDGSEVVDYTQDIGQNLDKIDAAVGFAACTASTRPSTPYQGKGILQTDTAYSTYVHNGTSPASGGWVEIPNSSAVYGGRLITLYPGSTSSSSLVRLAQTGTAAGNRAFATRGSGDTADHFFFDFDGKMQWGPGGSSAGDTNLYRGAANQLKTDDDLVVSGALTVVGSVAVNGGLAVTGSLSAGNISTGASTSYAVTWNGTSVSLGNGSLNGRYMLIGKWCVATVEFIAGSTTSFGTGAWSFSLPFTVASPSGTGSNFVYCGSARAHASNWYTGVAAAQAGTNTVRIYSHNNSPATEWKSDVPFSWSATSTNYFHFTVGFEIA